MNKKGYIYAMLSAFLFALLSIVSKIIYKKGISAQTLALLQSIITSITVWIYVAIFKRDKLSIRGKTVKVILQGVFGSALVGIFFYKSLYLINASITVMLLFISPVFVLLYYRIFKKIKLDRNNVLALVLTLFGCSLVVNIYGISDYKVNILGIIYGIIASVFYAFLNVNAEEHLGDIDPFVIVAYSSAIASIVLLILYKPTSITSVNYDFVTIISLLELSIVSNLVPVILVYKAINIIGAYKTSVVGTLELPITAVLSFFILGDKLICAQLLGVVIVIIGIIKMKR